MRFNGQEWGGLIQSTKNDRRNNLWRNIPGQTAWENAKRKNKEKARRGPQKTRCLLVETSGGWYKRIGVRCKRNPSPSWMRVWVSILLSRLKQMLKQKQTQSCWKELRCSVSYKGKQSVCAADTKQLPRLHKCHVNNRKQYRCLNAWKDNTIFVTGSRVVFHIINARVHVTRACKPYKHELVRAIHVS